MQIQTLIDLKSKHVAAQVKACKTKASRQREVVYDEIRKIRNEFIDEAMKIDWKQFDLTSLNIMAMVGGPYYVEKGSKVSIMDNLGSCLRVSIDGEWAGTVHLLESPCGIDNLVILQRQLNNKHLIA